MDNMTVDEFAKLLLGSARSACVESHCDPDMGPTVALWATRHPITGAKLAGPTVILLDKVDFSTEDSRRKYAKRIRECARRANATMVGIVSMSDAIVLEGPIADASALTAESLRSDPRSRNSVTVSVQLQNGTERAWIAEASDGVLGDFVKTDIFVAPEDGSADLHRIFPRAKSMKH